MITNLTTKEDQHVQPIADRSSLMISSCFTAAAVLARPAAPADEVNVKLKKIAEVRVQTLIEDNDQNQVNMFEQPGLQLTFLVELPNGVQLLDVAEPTAINASDAAGTDLTKVEENFMGEIEYIELQQMWNEPATEFKITLAETARQAAHFSLNATIDIATYTGTDTVDVQLTDTWQPVEHESLDPNVEARFTKQGGSLSVQFQPGSVRNDIEIIELVAGDQAIESNSSMWNDSFVRYDFGGAGDNADTVRITVRTGVKTTPVTIKLDKQALP